MTYPDDVLKAAREAAAQYWERLSVVDAQYSGWAAECIEGVFDGDAEVQSACIAIMAERKAERERCAGIARSTEAYDDRLQQASGFLTTGQRIANAILGQQEMGDDRA